MAEQIWCKRFPVGDGIHPRALLIAFPGAGKSADAWSEFANKLPPDLELLAINYPGRDRRFGEDIPSDLSELAAQIFAVLRVSLLTRPYVLVGHSMGSSVAAEVAMLAEQCPETLAPLGVISMGSTPGTEFEGPPEGADIIKWAKDFAVQGGMLSKEEVSNLDASLFKALANDLQANAKHIMEISSGKRSVSIKSPIFALAAIDDELAPPENLPNWAGWNAPGAPPLKTNGEFAGGHNFHDPPVPGLLDVIIPEVYEWLAQVPEAVVFGEVIKPRYPETTVHKQFHEACAKYSERFAVVDEKGNRFTYREFQHRVLILAKRLCGIGVKVDCICPIFMERSLEFMIAIYGILSAEGAFAQLEVSFPPETVDKILSKISPSIILTKERYTWKLPECHKYICMNDHHWMAIEQGLSLTDEAAYAAREEAKPDDLFKVPLTSGSTGIPKSIGQVHRSAVCSYWWRQSYLEDQEIENEASNVFFIWEALRPLLRGATLHIMSETCILDAHTFVDFVLERDITRMLLTPSMGETLVDQIQEQSFPADKRERLQKSRWSLLVHCGEVVSRVLQNKWLALLPKMTQINLYSIAEVYDVTCSMVDSESAKNASGLYMPAGPVMDGVTVMILRDGKNGLEVMPQNAVGDIYVAGPCMARGYLNNPEKTAEAFLSNPFTTGHLSQFKRIYKTGDIGRFVPGPAHDTRPVCEIWGRTDSVIKLRGYSVEKGAIKSAIQTYPGSPKIEWVEIFRDNCPKTFRTKRIIAAILPVKGSNDGISEADTLQKLKEWVRKKLPAYAIPTMCLIDEIPISASSGKGDMNKLLSTCLEKLVSQESVDSSASLGNSFPKELSVLVDVWNEILGHPPQDMDTSFFEDGGHSLLAAKFARMLSSRLQGAAIAIIDLMENPTPALLAKKFGLLGSAEPIVKVEEVPEVMWSGDRPEPIAIVGLSCQFCGLLNYQEFWNCLLQQKIAVREFSAEELVARGWSAEAVKHPDFKPFGGPLTDDGMFDRAFWKISQHEANLMDIQQRLFIQEAYTALEDAGRAQHALRPELTGVFAATWYSSYLLNALGGGGALRDPSLGPEDNHLTELGNCSEYAASRTAYLLDLRGMAVGVQTSCSSGLSTVLHGCAALHARQLDLALTGACSATVPGCGYIAGEGVPLSQDGMTRSFAKEATGTVFTDGVAVAVLKRSGNTEERDRGWASVRGYALNQDGAARASYSAPGLEGQSRCLQLALRHARVVPEDVGFIECHATGTTVGDHIEMRGIAKAYGTSCPLVGCGKPLIGHANLASGMAGLAKTAMVLKHNVVPGTLLLGTLNPLLGDVRVGLETQELPKAVASVSSFGIGGTNTHAVLERCEPKEEVATKAPPIATWVPFLPISAKTSQSLHSMAEAVGDFVRSDNANLVDMARRLAVRESFKKRMGIVFANNEDLPGQISNALKQTELDEGISVATRPVVALLFSGNGSYYARLGEELAEQCPVFKSALSEARAACGLTSEKLNLEPTRADIAQPGLFCVQYALLRTLEAWEVPVKAAVGHSLGLFPALVAAGALSLETAAKLITERGRLCQQASGGAMVSVAGITRTQVEEALTKLPVAGPKRPSISVANAPSLVVVSGDEKDLQLCVDSLKAVYGEKAKCRFLQVSNAYHHEFMRDAAEKFGEFVAQLGDIKPCSKCLVADNISGSWLPSDMAIKPSYFKEHMLQPVNFSANVCSLLALESERPLILLELGGVALKQIVEANLRVMKPSQPITTLTLSKHIKDEQKETVIFGTSLASAWQAGTPMNLELVCGGVSGSRSGSPPYWLPTYRFQKTRCWGSTVSQPKAHAQSSTQRLVNFGKAKPGAAIVIYCFPYAGGSSAVFYSWASKAPPSLEFVAVELPGRGVRSDEESHARLSYDAEVRQMAMSIEAHAQGRNIAVLGVSSGCVFALNVVSLLEEKTQVRKMVAVARAPPWTVGPESCKDDDESASSWMLADGKTCATSEFQTKQLPILKYDLSLDAEGCRWAARNKVKAPIHVFCGVADESFGPHMAHTWGEGMSDSSLLDISFVNGGHEFITGPEIKTRVYKSFGVICQPCPLETLPVPEATPANMKLKDVSSWLHEPVWEALPDLQLSAFGKKFNTVLFGLGDRFSEKLTRALQEAGEVAVIEKSATEGEDSCASIAAKLRAANAPSLGARSVIYAWLSSGVSNANYADRLRGHKQLVQALGALQGLGTAQDPLLVTIIANQATASVAGLAMAATQESATMLCRVVEIYTDPDNAVAHIVAEAFCKPCEMDRLHPVCALTAPHVPHDAVGRRCRRVGLGYRSLNIPVIPRDVNSKSQLSLRGTFLLTGAFGRIGRALAKHLATKWKANLILATRGSAKEEHETYRKSLEVDSNRVIITTNSFCDSVEAWNNLFAASGDLRVDGVFHLAGKANLKYMDELCETSNDHIIEDEFAPKELAVQTLQECISGLTSPPRFVMMFSSMAAILGGYGMGAYSAANRCLDSAAARLANNKATKWLSMNWDDWSFEYTVEQTAAYTDKAAARSMSPEEGFMVIESMLAADGVPPQVLVSTTALQPKMDEWMHQCPRLADLRNSAVAAVAPAKEVGSIEMAVARAFQEVLGLDSTPQKHEEFFDLGGDSVSAGPLLRSLKAALPNAKKVNISDIFTLQSVERISAALQSK